MRNVRWMILAAIAAVIATNLGCSHNEYSKARHEEYVDSFLPVDTIDAMHSWMLYQTRIVTLRATEGSGAERVQILTANPRESGDAEVVGETFISEGETVSLDICYPMTYQTLYAALVDAERRYTLVSFSPDAGSADFSAPLFTAERLSYEPQPQQFVFAFEHAYPEPGEYDYNSIVLHVSQERTGEREMSYHVTLAAVGATEQLGAAITLSDFGYDDIESVVTLNDDGEPDAFNMNNGRDVPDQLIYVMRASNNNKVMRDALLRGNIGQAVLLLFCDAHWATGDVLTEDYGQIQRKKYNVSKVSGTETQVMVPRTITYVVTYKDASRLNAQTLARIDPFIVREWGGGRWETHTYDHRLDKVFYNYTYTDMKVMPWSLVIPSSKYRHPLDGVVVGYLRNGYLFGAYAIQGHAFGEWVADRNKAVDWYLYPQETRVY